MKLNRSLLFAFFLFVSVATVNAQDAYKIQTFGAFQKMGAQPDKPIDFKTSFQPKSQVYILFTFPDKPGEWEVECYWLDNGQEKMRGTAVVKNFTTTGKPKTQYKGLGMLYDEGEYRVIVKDGSKNIVTESKFMVAGAVAAASMLPKAVITICEDTDDNLKPINPVKNNTINKGDGVNLQAKLNKGIGARFFIWAIYSINEAGEEMPWKDWQVDVASEAYTTFATDSKTYFTVPGKYVIYMLPQNATNTGTTIGNHEKYYGKATLTVLQ
jgi:hypothetical protein